MVSTSDRITSPDHIKPRRRPTPEAYDKRGFHCFENAEFLRCSVDFGCKAYLSRFAEIIFVVECLHQRIDSTASRCYCSGLVSIDEPLHRLSKFGGRRGWKVQGFSLIKEGYGHVGAIYIFITML